MHLLLLQQHHTGNSEPPQHLLGLLRDNWQHQRRRMLRVVQDGVRGGNKVARKFNLLASVEIAIEPGEIAARNLEAQRVPTKEYVTRPPQVDGDLVDLPWVHQVGTFR